jgi:thioredoxin 2
MKESLTRTCRSCGTENGIAGERLSETGRCGQCQAELPPVAEPLDANPVLFAQVVASASVPVLVDFWAEWCGPCQAAAPAVKKIAADMAGKVIVLKVDTDRYPELAEQFDVMGIPNFMVLKGGRVVTQEAGLVDARQLKRWIEMASAA